MGNTLEDARHEAYLAGRKIKSGMSADDPRLSGFVSVVNQHGGAMYIDYAFCFYCDGHIVVVQEHGENIILHDTENISVAMYTDRKAIPSYAEALNGG